MVQEDNFTVFCLLLILKEAQYTLNTFFKAALKDGGERPAPQKAAEAKPKESGYRTKEERAAETKKRLRVKQIEEEISALETEEAEINSQLALPEIAGNYELLKEKCARLEEVKNLLDGLYEEYETLID